MMSTKKEDDIKRWTAKRKSAPVLDIIQGKTTVAEASRQYDLSPSEVEQWVDDGKLQLVLCQEFITPHCPQQSGMVERVIHTLKEQCLHRHRFETIQNGRFRDVAGWGGWAVRGRRRPDFPGAFSYRARKPTMTRAIRPYLVAL